MEVNVLCHKDCLHSLLDDNWTKGKRAGDGGNAQALTSRAPGKPGPKEEHLRPQKASFPGCPPASTLQGSRALSQPALP